MKITEHTYNWAYPLTTRSGKPDGVVWHNAAAEHCTPEAIHEWHLHNDWAGIAYHFVVLKNGLVVRGRPEDKLGGHALGASRWIGICFEGDYERIDKVMPPAQLKAGKWLHSYLTKKYGALKDMRHKDMPGNSTACPGKYFPFKELTR